MKLRFFLPAAILLAGTVLFAGGVGVQRAGAQAAGRQTFQKLLLVPADDKDYVVTRIPDGGRAVVTDIVAYNTADGSGHRVGAEAESYVWVGGYQDNKSLGLVNRMRILGNATEQWHLQTGLELTGAKELVVSSEKAAPNASAALVYVNGYIDR